MNENVTIKDLDLIKAEDIDQNDFSTFLGSEFVVATPYVQDVCEALGKWIKNNACGGMVYSASRTGKSSCIQFSKTYLAEKHDLRGQVFLHNCTTDTNTAKAFYERLLDDMKVRHKPRMTANELRVKVVRALYSIAEGCKYQRIIFFFDEANLLSDKEFELLVDLYNEMRSEKVLLSVFLFGTESLNEKKAEFVKFRQMQIVNRFMLNTFKMPGVDSKKMLQAIMDALDGPFTYAGKDMIFSGVFFPEAYADGLTLTSFASDFWNGYMQLCKDRDIEVSPLTMEMVVQCIRGVCDKYGAAGKKLYKPTKEAWMDILEESGLMTVLEMMK